MIGCEVSKEILLEIMLLSIISVVPGADGAPGGLWAPGLASSHGCTMHNGAVPKQD